MTMPRYFRQMIIRVKHANSLEDNLHQFAKYSTDMAVISSSHGSGNKLSRGSHISPLTQHHYPFPAAYPAYGV